MKTTAKKIARDESGKILILVLVLLVVGGLLLTPLLGLMSTGLVAGQVYEKKASELYAADAGVEDAIWKITNPGLAELPHSPCRDVPWTANYTIGDVNDKEVQFSIAYVGREIYTITSMATANGSGTRIEALVLDAFRGYGAITDNVITSRHDIDFSPNAEADPPEGQHGPVDYYRGPWPDLRTLSDWYLRDVSQPPQYYGSTEIDVRGNNCPSGPIYINDVAVDCPQGLGPLYIDGPLEITNSEALGGDSPTPVLKLIGTLYITGDTTIEPTKRLIIDLNGHAIFVQSSSQKPPKHALYVKGPEVTFRGPGVIVAMGDIYFEPNIEAGMTDPIFVISVGGTTTLKPGGEFYGAVAGHVQVELQGKTSVTYPEDGFPEDLNWPGFKRNKWAHFIASWTIGPA